MKTKRLTRSIFPVILFLVLARTMPAPAITINMYFDSSSSDNPSYDPTGSLLTSIMQSVKSYWQDILEDSHTLTVYYYWQDLDIYSSGVLAAHLATGMNYTTGRETSCTIRFDTASYGSDRIWYFDPTPFDSSEFDIQQKLYGDLSAASQSGGFNGDTPELLEVGYRGSALSSAPTEARNGADMFSVALHEVGHGLGLTGAVARNELYDYDYDIDPLLVHGETMAVNTYSTSDIYHVKADDALMNPYTRKGTRTLPSATDVFAMAAASRWTAIDLPRKDFWGGESWNTAFNWEGNRVPDSGDEVSVRHGGLVTLNGAGIAGKLRVDNAGTLDTGVYSLTVAGATQIDGASELIVGNGGSLTSSYVTLINQSHLHLAGGTVHGNSSESNLNISADSSLTGHGTLNLDVINYGSMSPGHSETGGAITINGDFTQGACGLLTIELGGLNAGVDSDLLTISGQANLAGVLELNLINGFVPSPGDTFTILTYGSSIGSFDAISNWIIGDGLYFGANDQATAMTLMTLHAIPGDANYDGLANEDDLNIMADYYSQTLGSTNWEMADFNGDGSVDWNDLILLAANYTNSDGTIGIDPALLAPMVPEPSVLGLLATAGPAFFRRRRFHT